MCGLTGAFAFNGGSEVLTEAIERANDTLKKRGPDGGGKFQAGKVVLAHRRLSIIDVSCAGNQPMHSADGRFTIVFNGEIFNYQELRDKYLTRQEQENLRSRSDTEIFLHLYQKMNVEAFMLLDGFFAAAIYDNQSGELLLVRDRFGKKPLLYFQDNEKLIFASEMKALFAAGIPKEINWDILPVYLQLNYIPQPESMVKGVRKLLNGCYLKVNGNNIEEHQYYKLELHPEKYNDISYSQAQARLVDLMDKAVQKRLISDVPLGAFLSGGIDSSVIVALASRHTQHLKTFSIGYKDHPYFDETSYAKLVAEKYKTEHTVFSLSNDDFLEHIQDVMNYIDEPFADSSAIPEFILSYHTRKHVTVSLSGDGGDEVFAGYNKHAAEWRMRREGMVNQLVKASHPVLKLLPKSRNNKLTNTFRQLYRFSSGARLNAADRYWHWAGFNTEEGAKKFLHPDIRKKISASCSSDLKQQFTRGIAGKDFNEVLLADMNLVLLSDMLVKVDLMSMANSLEIRSPFLDADVVEFAFGLPSEYKIDGKMKKRIVQDSFRNQLPSELYNRPKKGFEIPLLDWFNKELWSLIDNDLLKDDFILEQAIFDVEEIRSLKRKLRSHNPGDSHATIWALLVFQQWWKNYIAG